MEAPGFLSSEAKAEWARILASGIQISEADQGVLAAYCQNWARWQAAEMAIERDGPELVIRSDKGTVKQVLPSPQIGIAGGALGRMLAAASYLGLKAKPSSARPRRQVSAITTGPMPARARKRRISIN